MDVNVFIEPKLDLPRLASVLDEIGHEARVWATKRWSRDLQARLFEGAAGFRPVSLADFVPESTPPLTEVIHHGHNTLAAFTEFEKRFCRPEDEQGVLYGYNHNATMGLTGPGYFVVHPAERAGEVAIDYTLRPGGKAAGWPDIIPNEDRLGRFVYAGMIDYMRGISSHVSIGRAARNGEFIDAWFVLVRKDPATP